MITPSKNTLKSSPKTMNLNPIEEASSKISSKEWVHMTSPKLPKCSKESLKELDTEIGGRKISVKF